MKNFFYLFIFFIISLSKPVYATEYNVFSTEEEIAEQEELHDPFEKFNRKIYAFNKAVDKYSLKPLAKTYRKVTPTSFRTAVGNVFSNLTIPLTTINSLLQLDFKNTGKSILRFTINSTIGILGIFDVATKMNIKINKEDLGQTFAKYHIPSGPYLMMPFIGPFTLRSLSGFGIEWVANPMFDNIADNTEKRNMLYGLAALNIINKREKIYDDLEDIENNTLDPYSVIKSAYIQKRQALINNE